MKVDVVFGFVDSAALITRATTQPPSSLTALSCFGKRGRVVHMRAGTHAHLRASPAAIAFQSFLSFFESHVHHHRNRSQSASCEQPSCFSIVLVACHAFLIGEGLFALLRLTQRLQHRRGFYNCMLLKCTLFCFCDVCYMYPDVRFDLFRQIPAAI